MTSKFQVSFLLDLISIRSQKMILSVFVKNNFRLFSYFSPTDRFKVLLEVLNEDSNEIFLEEEELFLRKGDFED